MSTLLQGQKLLAILPAIILTFLLTAHPLHGQYVTTTVPAGTNPRAVAVNPVTNKIYVANYSTNSVMVIDGATNTTITLTDPAAISPYAVAVNTMTNKIYVANCGTCSSSTGNGSGSVTVIDGATNATTNLGLGFNPWALAVNPVTNEIYVANCGNCGGGTGKGNIMVIDGTTNTTTTVTDPYANGPAAIAVNPVTNKIYVANQYSNNVSVINGATNRITRANSGKSPGHIAVNPVTDKIYVTNGGSGTVTVIDGATNAEVTLHTGSFPAAVAVNPVSNKIYVSLGIAVVLVIDGATNAMFGVATESDPWGIAVNPVTNKIYVANCGVAPCGNGGGSVTVIDGATNSTTTLTDPSATNPYAVAVNPVTNKIYVGNEMSANVSVIDGATNSTITVADPSAAGPFAVDVNPVTNKIYVANYNSKTVTVIDGATNSTTAISVVGVPRAVAVNSVTNKIYVTNCYCFTPGANNGVTVIDGATNATTTISAGMDPWAVAVNPVTNKIYVANDRSYDVTVIDGETNSTIRAGATFYPMALAVNPVTNRIYVANAGGVTVTDGGTNSSALIGNGGTDGGAYGVVVNPVTNKIYMAYPYYETVVVIDGVTNSVTLLFDSSMATSTNVLAVNPLTNKIYVAGYPIMVIDGATNSTTTMSMSANVVAVNAVTNKIYAATGNNVTVIDGETNATTTVSAGSGPQAIAVNPVTNNIYVANNGSNNVTVIKEAQVPTIPLVTAITPLAGDQTPVPTPTFDFTATSSFSPTAPAPLAVWYQLDTWQRPWLPASGTEPNFSATTPSLSLGTHILYAFATDGQDANSTGGALIGSMTAYLFDVVLPGTTTTLTSSPNPSNYGEPVTFMATVTVNRSFSGTPTGTVGFYANGGFLGSATLAANGQTVYTTTALPGGPENGITAIYSGDTNFLESDSAALVQQVNAVPLAALSTKSVGFGYQVILTTSATKMVMLTNKGDAPLNISSISASANFAVSSTTCGATLAAGKYCYVYVTFTPPMLGKLTGTLAFADNALNSPQTVALSGFGVEPATLTPAIFTYPVQAVATTSSPKIFTLTNYQAAVLNNIVISTSGDFAVSSTTCTTSLAAHGNCTISVTFTPTMLGTRAGQLRVIDDANNSPQTSALTGTGALPATLTPATFAYPAQVVGTTSAPKAFTLTNNESVTLNNIVISATGDFAVSSTTCTTSLAAKSHCTISVTFAPTATGTRTGQLSVNDDASNSPQKSNLTGTGT